MPARSPEEIPRVLVIDDDPVVVSVLRYGLEARGIEVVSAPDGATGLRAVIENLLDLDLLVTDLQMPGLDGVTVVRIIRSEGGERELPILVLATAASPHDRGVLAKLGVSGIVEKSAGSEQIVRLATALARSTRRERSKPWTSLAMSVPLAPIRLARSR